MDNKKFLFDSIKKGNQNYVIKYLKIVGINISNELLQEIVNKSIIFECCDIILYIVNNIIINTETKIDIITNYLQEISASTFQEIDENLINLYYNLNSNLNHSEIFYPYEDIIFSKKLNDEYKIFLRKFKLNNLYEK